MTRPKRYGVVAVAVLGACLAGLSSLKAAPAVPVDRFGGIVIDTSRLERFGSPRTAALLQRQLAVEARQIFADRLTPGDRRAPTLVIKIDSLSMASYAGASDRTFPGSGNMDYLEGDGAVTSGGQVLSSTHVLSVLDAGYSGPWNLPDIDDRRIVSISHQFAYWLRREMGL